MFEIEDEVKTYVVNSFSNEEISTITSTKYYISGGTGFIGKWLVCILNLVCSGREQPDIKIISRSATNGARLFQFYDNVSVTTWENIKPNDKVFVFLDSNHTYEHVYNELMLYSKIVSKNSYIVACDGVMSLVNDTPRGKKYWKRDNPIKAIKKFLKNNKNFILDEPVWLFNESKLFFNNILLNN